MYLPFSPAGGDVRLLEVWLEQIMHLLMLFRGDKCNGQVFRDWEFTTV